MSFAETYSHEVLETRRIRAQRARFWAKLVSLLLMITIAATLRSEPQLRAALMEKGIDAVSALRGAEPPRDTFPTGMPGTAAADPDAVMNLLKQMQPGAMSPTAPETAAHPATPAEPRIKINRPGSDTAGSGPRFLRVTPDAPRQTPAAQTTAPAPDMSMQDMMKQIGTLIGGISGSE